MNDDFNQVAANLSENARFALQKADTFAKMYNQGAVQTEHLLLGILAQDTSTGARLLADEGVHLEDAEKTMENPPVEVREKEMSMMSLTEAVVLNVPMKWLHDSNCKGICKVCGINLNKQSCQCDAEEIDPRLEGLRNLFHPQSEE